MKGVGKLVDLSILLRVIFVDSVIDSNSHFASHSCSLQDRIKNADQLITVDVAKFSNSLAEMYSNLAKPTLDVLLYNYQLSRNVGAEGLIIITVLVQGSAYLLRALTPPFGQYAATEQQLEGEFRFTHSRLIENAEEVALYRGSWVEKNIVERAYFSLIKHVNRVYRIRIGHGMVEEGIIKWLWGSLGVSTLKCLGRGKGGGKGKDSGSWPAQVEIGEMGP